MTLLFSAGLFSIGFSLAGSPTAGLASDDLSSADLSSARLSLDSTSTGLFSAELSSVGLISAPLLFVNSANSFEFPDKLPYGDISANVGFYSQYVWRGERQNDGQSAVQGGLDYGVTLLDTYIDAYVGF